MQLVHVIINVCTDLDVQRAGEDFVSELVAVKQRAGPDVLIGLHPPELEPVPLVVAGTLEHGRFAWGDFDDGVLLDVGRRPCNGRAAVVGLDHLHLHGRGSTRGPRHQCHDRQ